MHMRDAKKLINLANFLKQLPPKRFNFSHVVDVDKWKGNQNLSCGTTACAIGWCPTIWPRHLKLVRYGTANMAAVVLISEVKDDIISIQRNFFETDIGKFFGISKKEANELFQPGTYCSWMKGEIKALSCLASAKRVAQHIEEFVLHKLSS